MNVSVLIPHYRTPWWTAICIHRFKQYPMPVGHEIIVCDNSPGDKSIKCLTKTSLGEGVKIINGNPDFPSHGMGYDLAYAQADGDWIFTSETDSFPIREGWFDEYSGLWAVYGCDLIGPEMPQSAGRYIHPAGALINRDVLAAAEQWRSEFIDWIFAPGAALPFKTSGRGYHVVTKEDTMLSQFKPGAEMLAQVELWKQAGAWQEMRSFEEDSFDTYSQRTGITHFTPQMGIRYYNKIGYEAGQWLSYFAAHHEFKVLKAPVTIEWMNGFEGQQAARSVIFDGFEHIWAGTVAALDNGLNPFVRAFKMDQMENAVKTLPNDLIAEIKASGAL